MDLLKAVQTNLKEVKGKSGRRINSRKADRPGYRPMPHREGDFWRLKKLMGPLTFENYHTDSDCDYQPGDEVEEVERAEEEEEEETETGDTSFNGGNPEIRVSSVSRGTSGSSYVAGPLRTEASRTKLGPRLPYWVRALSRPETFDPESEKFVPIDK